MIKCFSLQQKIWKSIDDCLNNIDEAIVENKGKYFGISNLENIHKYSLEIGQIVFIDDRVALSNVVSQIDSIIENFYQFPEEDKKSEFIHLTKLILDWLKECNTKPEVDAQQ